MNKKLHIMGIDYSVTVGNIKQEGWTCFGLADLANCHIVLNKVLSTGQKEESLLHEIVHIVSSRLGAGLSEKQVILVAAGLYAVLKDNPKCLRLDKS